MLDQSQNPFIKPHFLKHLNIDKISCILELGARDGLYTKFIKDCVNADTIICIEANPFLIPYIKENLNGLENVSLHNIALFDKIGNIDFYLHSDGGSSSIFKYPNVDMEKIQVPCTTLDEFCRTEKIEKIDLICADIEGAEAAVFKNSNMVKKCSYIITEVKFDEDFKGKDFPNIKDMQESLHPLGFEMVETLVAPGVPFGDSLWINKNI